MSIIVYPLPYKQSLPLPIDQTEKTKTCFLKWVLTHFSAVGLDRNFSCGVLGNFSLPDKLRHKEKLETHLPACLRHSYTRT